MSVKDEYISLKQIKILRDKINSTVQLIKELRYDNSVLTEKVHAYEKRIEELESLTSDLYTEQESITREFNGVMYELDTLIKEEKSTTGGEVPSNQLDESANNEVINGDPAEITLSEEEKGEGKKEQKKKKNEEKTDDEVLDIF